MKFLASATCPPSTIGQGQLPAGAIRAVKISGPSGCRRLATRSMLPDGDGALAVAEDGVGAGFVEQAVLVLGVLMLGDDVLFQSLLGLGGFEVGDAKVGVDVGVIYAARDGLRIGGDGLRPLSVVLVPIA